MNIKQFQLEKIHIETKILRYIVAIVNENSLTKASELLDIPQPNLSRHLKNVETLINAKIFHRNNNKLELTNAGKIFINGARNIIHAEDEMLKKLRTTRQDRQNSLYISAEEIFYDILKNKIIPLYNKKYPNIALFLTKARGSEVRRLTREGFSDIGFCCGDIYNHPSITSKNFVNSKFVLCTSNEFNNNEFENIEENNKSDDLTYFSNREFLYCSDEFINKSQTNILNYYNIQNPIISCIASIHIVLNLIRNGHGNVIIPEYLLNDISSKRKVALSPNFEFNGIIIYNNRFFKGKAVGTFVDFIKPYLREKLVY